MSPCGAVPQGRSQEGWYVMALSTPSVRVSPVNLAATGTLSTGSFTPAANSLVMVMVAISGAAAATGNWTLSNMTVTGGSGMGSWSLIQNCYGGSNGSAIHVFYATAPASPAPMTCSFSVSGVDNRVAVVEVTGHDTTTPVVGTNGYTAATTTMSTTLTESPTADDLVLGVCGSRNTLDGATPGTNFTELIDSYNTATPCAQLYVEYDTGTTSTTVDATSFGVARNSWLGFIIKVAVDTGTPVSSSDTGSGADAVSILSATMAAADTGSGTEGVSLTVTLSSADASSATESATVSSETPKAGSEGSSSTENSSLVTQITPQESALGATETASVVAQVGSSQPASASEGAALLASVPGQSQASVGSDAATLAAAVAGSDLRQSTEVATLVVTITAADVAAAVEAVGVLARTVADTGTATEEGLAELPGEKIGGDTRPSAAEAASLSAAGLATEVRPVAESTSLSATLPSQSNPVVSSEAALLLVNITRADSAMAAEAASVSAALASSEPGNVSETATLVAVITASDLMAAVEGALVRAAGARPWTRVAATSDASGVVSVNVSLSGGREAHITIKRLEG